MAKLKKRAALLLLLSLLAAFLSGCKKQPEKESSSAAESSAAETKSTEFVDYAARLKLDMNSDSLKQEVTVKNYIDGDTTHFHVPASVNESGVLKARYLAVDTPESTGKIEEYGKAASNFTKEKLSSASSIYIESDDGNWNLDSTGGRYLVWVWYKAPGESEYRNLNLELLQNGLAAASNSGQNRYGSICMEALSQARALKLKVYSGQKDPDFFYGDAVELTLKELRTNIQNYNGSKVAFEGVITKSYNNSVYLEDYDEETDMYYGMAVYYGYGLNGDGLNILSVGNRSRIVGTVSYYETGGTWQVSGLTYRQMKPNDPGNIQKISEGNEAAYRETDAKTFAEGKLEVETQEGEKKSFSFGALAMDTSVSMKGLEVVSVYTTDNADSSSKGAMTLTCEKDGVRITVRTVVLYDENRQLVTAEYFERSRIDVKGLVDYFDGEYQIKLYSLNDVTVK